MIKNVAGLFNIHKKAVSLNYGAFKQDNINKVAICLFKNPIWPFKKKLLNQINHKADIRLVLVPGAYEKKGPTKVKKKSRQCRLLIFFWLRKHRKVFGPLGG